MSIPVVIATNGIGIPVREVTSGAPEMQVTDNGFGIPIVLSSLGAPFVVLGATVYDPDAQALFARFTTQPTSTRKQLISDQFAAGKATTWWTKLDALWVHAAHEAEAGRLNWLSAAFNCLPVAGPVFTIDRGYAGDGTASYLNTQFNPAVETAANYQQDSATLGIRSNTNSASNGSLAGFFDGTSGTTINPRDANDRAAGRVNQATNVMTAAGAVLDSIGMFVANRTGPTAMQVYRDGVELVASTAASSPRANGALRLGSITDTSFRAAQFSMGFIGAGLTPAEVASIYNWFEPYRTGVGVGIDTAPTLSGGSAGVV